MIRSQATHLAPIGGLILLLAASAVSPAAAQVPADAVLSGFEPIGDLLLEIAGEDNEDAEIYHADRAQAYLILSRALGSPVLVELRSRQVSQIHLMKVARRDDGTVDVLADADLRRLGAFSVSGTAVSFEVDGKVVKLKERPPLLGLHDRQQMVDHDPGYGQRAGTYVPDTAALGTLRATGKAVKVRVYFGSWCPFCKRHVPYILRVDQELQGTNVAIEYYGLPKDFDQDAEAERDKIGGVPTGVVYIDGKEVGRLTRAQWQAPEVELSRLVKAAG